jgi:hypothetical protein
MVTPPPADQFECSRMCALTLPPLKRESPPKFHAAHWLKFSRKFR